VRGGLWSACYDADSVVGRAARSSARLSPSALWDWGSGARRSRASCRAHPAVGLGGWASCVGLGWSAGQNLSFAVVESSEAEGRLAGIPVLALEVVWADC